MELRVGKSNDAEQIIANLQLFSKSIDYSVRAALRRAAQYTTTQTKRRVKSKTGIPQKYYKNQLQTYYRPNPQTGGGYLFRSWKGHKRRWGADEVPVARRKAIKAGAFHVPPLGKGLFRRDAPGGRLYRVYALDLNDFDVDMRRIGLIGGRRIYRQRLATELRTRIKKAKDPAEAKRLQSGITALLNRQRRELEVPDGTI